MPAFQVHASNGGTAITVERSARIASVSFGQASGDARTARSRSRLYSAAPYNTHACPPIYVMVALPATDWSHFVRFPAASCVYTISAGPVGLGHFHSTLGRPAAYYGTPVPFAPAM